VCLSCLSVRVSVNSIVCLSCLLQPDLHYHTSAVLSAAVDSFSVPYRKTNNPSLLTDLTSALSLHGRKVCDVILDLFVFVLCR